MVVLEQGGAWIIVHGCRVVDIDFLSEDEAWAWADANIDDQVFDQPNNFSPPIAYRPSRTNHWEPEIIRELVVPDRGRVLVVRVPTETELCRPGRRIVYAGEELVITAIEYTSDNRGPRLIEGYRVGIVVEPAGDGDD